MTPQLILASFIPFLPPAADQWAVRTDRTEREGGATTATVRNTEFGILFEGLLQALPGERGPVGFAIARTGWSPGPSDGVVLHLRASEPLVFIIAASTIHSEASSGPEFTYQQRVQVSADTTQYELLWANFEAYTRGRPLEGAPPLRPTEIVALAIQITRSSQAPDKVQRIPLPFSIHAEWPLNKGRR